MGLSGVQESRFGALSILEHHTGTAPSNQGEATVVLGGTVCDCVIWGLDPADRAQRERRSGGFPVLSSGDSACAPGRDNEGNNSLTPQVQPDLLTRAKHRGRVRGDAFEGEGPLCVPDAHTESLRHRVYGKDLCLNAVPFDDARRR